MDLSEEELLSLHKALGASVPTSRDSAHTLYNLYRQIDDALA
jgi:hypothetical protein